MIEKEGEFSKKFLFCRHVANFWKRSTVFLFHFGLHLDRLELLRLVLRVHRRRRHFVCHVVDFLVRAPFAF